MSRVKLTEYRAKNILLGDSYAGRLVRSGEAVPEGQWVAKVDQGVKKRMKQGLLAINVDAAKAKEAMSGWEQKGFSQFILEPLFPHEASEEQYFSMERVREGIRILHAKDGGIEIESHPEAVTSVVIAGENDFAGAAAKTGLPENFLRDMVAKFDAHFFAFLEINPLIIRESNATLLDAAVLVDSAGEFFTTAWGEDDLVKERAKHAAEGRVEAIAATTAASLKLNVLNTDGAIFFLLSGGGGSIVIADEAQLQGAGQLLGNYGEYSGGPTREETYLYSKEVIALMLASKSPKKALVIAGGVANFTDVKKTFAGIIDALTEQAEELRKQGVKVFIRRGGPNEKAGLDMMRIFLEKENLLGAVYGSDAVITKAVEDAINFVKI